MFDAVDGADEVTVGDGVGGLFEFPEVFAEAGDGGGRVEDDLGAVQAEGAGAFGKVAVVADVDADFGEAEVEDGEAEVAGAEVEFFPEAGRDVRDVALAVLAEVGAVVMDDGGGVVIDALLGALVDGHDEGDAMLAGDVAQEGDCGAVGDGFGGIVPADVLLGAEVGAGEDLLHADDLRAGLGGLADVSEVLFDHALADFVERSFGSGHVGGLD